MIITHFHLFCGAGGGALGFNQGTARVGSLTARFQCLGGVDHDPAAIRDFGRLVGVPGTVLDLFDREQYTAFHGRAPAGDWREATPQDLHAAAQHQRPDIVFLSAPCLPGCSEVLTPQGPRRIETLRAGDLVLTHKGRYREVLKVGTHHYTGDMFGFRLNGTVDVQAFTAEHPLWRRKVVRNEATGRKRALGPAEFVRADQVRVGDRIGFPVDAEAHGTAESFVRSVGEAQKVTKGGKATGRYAKPQHEMTDARIVDLTPHALSPHLWFLFGAYLGDGYRRAASHEVIYCVGGDGSETAEAVRQALRAVGLGWHEDKNGPTNVKIRVRARHLFRLVGEFGDGAAEKRIPEVLMRVETACMEAMIAGYRLTDGSEQDRRTPPGGNELQVRWKIPSVSLSLLRDLQRLLLRTGQYGRIHQCWAGGPQVIEGRTVQTRPRWELAVALDAVKRTAHEFIDGAVWIRVREISRRPASEPVWNLEVDEDNTFCVHLMATHNCKGFSGLISGAAAASLKYQALNQLALRGLMLLLAAWGDNPPPLILFENVPRISQRGRHLLDQIRGLLEGHGYAVAETTHDCGEIGGLAQHRRRFLLVARHRAKVPAVLYEPPRRRVLPIGEVLGKLLMPEHPAAGPMHRLPRLKWDTWLRLALIPAGGGTVTGEAYPSTGRFSVADPRPVLGSGRVYRVVPWDEPSTTITPRLGQHAPAHTVTGSDRGGSGAPSVADPRPWAGAGHYGVIPWDQPSGAITASGGHDNGRGNVADPRLPDCAISQVWAPPEDVPLIISLDYTWHRPLTTYELAALQGFPVGQDFALDGQSHTRWREAIGNAMPPPAAQAIAGVMGQVLLMAATGQTFALSSTPIWVRELAIALAVSP